MRPVLTAEEYRRVDKAYQGDLIEAMDRAGHAVALAAVRNRATYGRRVVVLAGPGNNGGDGYVAARYLKARGAAVEIHALAEPKTPEAIDAANKARAAGVAIRKLGEPVNAGVVIDALFGGGVRRGLPEEVKAWMGQSARVIAVDFPTGLDPDTGQVEEKAFRAVETVTFSTLKTGHVRKSGPDHCGKVTVAKIGIEGGEPSMFVAEEEDAPRPSRRREAHKWSAGAVLVVGGSTGLLGAAVYAGRSALHFGAGSVYIASPNPGSVHQIAPELPAISLDDAGSYLDRFDVVVAGPGLAGDDISNVLPIFQSSRHVVLDAGALTEDVLKASKRDDSQVLITPHSREYERLFGLTPGAYSVRANARDREITILLKGNPTIVTNGGPPVLVTSGGPELASIGTGDVLAGMIGALWARGLDSTTAAISAAYWHGRAAADLRRSRTVTADLLADHIASYAW